MIDASDWVSFHLYYHSDRNRALLGFVEPVAASLVVDDWIDHFFFIRYLVGGSHLRLRVRPLPELRAAVEERLVCKARDFLSREPSTTSLSEDEIRRQQQFVLTNEPRELDVAFPDNSFQFFSLELEVERYGGPELIEDSLSLFALSSLRALDFVAAHGAKPWSKQLPMAFKLLAGQARGLATTGDGFLELLDYFAGWRDSMTPIVAAADRVFDASPEPFRMLLLGTLEAGCDEAARALGWAIRDTDPATRKGIETSQLHMTANRIGLKNTDEVYLTRLASRAASEAAQAEPSRWAAAMEAIELTATSQPPLSLTELRRQALGQLASRIGVSSARAKSP